MGRQGIFTKAEHASGTRDCVHSYLYFKKTSFNTMTCLVGAILRNYDNIKNCLRALVEIKSCAES